MKHLLRSFQLLIITFALLFSQSQTRFIYLDEDVHTYDYYDYLVNSGRYIPDYVLLQPYVTEADTQRKQESDADQYFNDYWRHYYGGNKNLSLNINIDGTMKFDEAVFGRFKAEGALQYVNSYITLVNRTTVDQNYKYDRNFAGDLSKSDHWLYGRVNEAYINLNYKAFNFFYGRMKRNWGGLSEKSLILSSVPYTYDHFLFDYTTKYFKLSIIYASLENMDALEFFPDSTIIAVNNARKHFVGHRLDIKINKNIQFAFSEMAIYGGENRPFEAAFLNPLTFYYALQRNDKKYMSGLWSAEAFWKPFPKLTLYGQFLLDDIVVNNDPGEDYRAKYPDRLGLNISVKSADYIKGLNLSLSYIRIWNDTYQSRRTYENYQYRNLGLAYPCASSEEIKLNMAYWNLFPLFIKNETNIGRYGDVSLSDLFMLKKRPFPVPPAINNVVNITDIVYFFNANYRVSAQFIYRKNINHYSNRFGDRDNFVINIKFNAVFALGYNL